MNSESYQKFSRPKPVVLVILDGWGVNQPYPGNAVHIAKTPFFDSLVTEYPSTTLQASGAAVGLPWGESGNSEVGHLNIGLGRVLYHNLARINKEINEGTFYNNQALMKAVNCVKVNKSKLHFVGTISNSNIHASMDHLYALLLLAKENNIEQVYIHALLDGRDTTKDSGYTFIKGVEQTMKEYQIGRIVSVSGRKYGMDRNNNWERTCKAYQAISLGKGNLSKNAAQAIKDSYADKIYDEDFLPTVIVDTQNKPIATVDDNDAVVFFNFRGDRARQLAKIFVDKQFEECERKEINNVFYTSFTEYEKDMEIDIVFPREEIKNTLGKCLEKNDLMQLRISETEKYSHVTYFFNGGTQIREIGEEHNLVPSPLIDNYTKKPEMSSQELTRRVVEAIKSDNYDFIVVNYPNADMLGHIGDINAAVEGIEAIDKSLEMLYKSVLSKNGVLIITADHGNVESLYDMQTGQKDKEHTSNPVPFILVGKDFRGKNFEWSEISGHDLSLAKPQGILADIAPTILQIMNIDKPSEMTGISLIK